MQHSNVRHVGQVANLSHQVVSQSSGRHARGLWLVTTLLTFAVAGSGFAGHVYRASKLPPELMAPAPLSLDTINLSGLADQSVSAEVISRATC